MAGDQPEDALLNGWGGAGSAANTPRIDPTTSPGGGGLGRTPTNVATAQATDAAYQVIQEVGQGLAKDLSIAVGGAIIGKIVPSGPLGGSASKSPVAGVPRVGNALKADPHHAFPDLIDNFAGYAQQFSIPTKGPGGKVVRYSKLYQLEGSLNGNSGIFEWIIDMGNVTHRRFIRNGKITGIQNQIAGR